MPEHPAKRTSPSRPYDVLFQMIISKWITQALGTVVELGVPDQLSKGARQCSRIARDAGVSEDCARRIYAVAGWQAAFADRNVEVFEAARAASAATAACTSASWTCESGRGSCTCRRCSRREEEG